MSASGEGAGARSDASGTQHAPDNSGVGVVTSVLVEALCARPTPDGTWTAPCPAAAHEGREATLSIRGTSDGKPSLACDSGCSYGQILDALDPELAEQVRGEQSSARDAHARLMQIVDDL